MEPAECPTQTAQRLSWLPWLLVVGLFVWQGWLTLSLFGPDEPWARLLSDEPILSGAHPLHLYHGYLGSRSWLATGQLCCYDPSFQTGYLKTPLFDHASRPAELFLTLAGGEFRPAAYKIGLACVCMLAPLLLLITARSVGVSGWTTVTAIALGLLIWWSGPGREALEVGDVEVLLAALAALAQLGLLVQYHYRPGFLAWLGLVLTSWLGWFAHPLLYLIVVPLSLIYYVTVGVRHKMWCWHFFLLQSQVLAILCNLFWLVDWVRYWWIRSPWLQTSGILEHRTILTFWRASIWGESADRTLAVAVLVSALIGVVIFNQRCQRVTARLFGLGGATLFVLALLGISWQQLGRIGTAGLFVPALLFAVVPAAYAWCQCAKLLVYLTPCWWVRGLAAAAIGAGLSWPVLSELPAYVQHCQSTAPLDIGLVREQQQLVTTLTSQTTAEARILWEDRPGPRSTSRWTALLPLLTERVFIGGLDPAGQIEHSHAGFVGPSLAGRSIAQWSDAALGDYCKRYNVGWIAVWSPASIRRLRAWQDGAAPLAELRDDAPGVLFKVRRDEYSYALKGQARLVRADCSFITLADVVPEDGRVVLSLHYQSGMRATPSRVVVEPQPDALDSIPLVRLRVASPVARVTLSWSGQ